MDSDEFATTQNHGTVSSGATLEGGRTPGWMAPPAMRFGEAVATCLRRYASFSGRASKSEFWWFFLFVILISVTAGVLGTLLAAVLAGSGVEPETASAGGTLPYLVSLALVVPYLAAQVRRLHDIGHGGGWVLINFIPLGGLVLLAVLSSGGQRHPNRWDRSSSATAGEWSGSTSATLTSPPVALPHHATQGGASTDVDDRSRGQMFTSGAASPAQDRGSPLGTIAGGARRGDSQQPANTMTDQQRTRTVRIIVGTVASLLLIIVGVFIWSDSRRDPQMEKILANASRSEAFMLQFIDNIDLITADFEQRFAEAEPTEDDWLDLYYAVSGEASNLRPRLIDASAAINDVQILPWHGDIRRFHGNYIDHLDAWIADIDLAIETPEDWLNYYSQEVSTTWLATIRSAQVAGKGRSAAVQTEIIRLFPISELEPT